MRNPFRKAQTSYVDTRTIGLQNDRKKNFGFRNRTLDMKILVKFAVFSAFSYTIFIINFSIKRMKTHLYTQFFMLNLMVILDRTQYVQIEMQALKGTLNDSALLS